MVRTRVLGDVRLPHCSFGPFDRMKLHLSLTTNDTHSRPGISIPLTRPADRSSILELRYPHHSILVALDLSPSLFLVSPNRCEVLLLDTLSSLLTSVLELTPSQTSVEVTVILTGLTSGFRVATHGHPLSSSDHAESILRLTETMLTYVVALRRSARQRVTQPPLSTHLSAGVYCLRLLEGLPTMVVVSDCSWGVIEVGQYGDILMELQAKDIRVIFLPLPDRLHFGFVPTPCFLRFLALSTGGLVLSRPSDLDARFFSRTSKLHRLDKCSHLYRTTAVAGAGDIARFQLAEYTAACCFDSFLRCRITEGFFLLHLTEDAATFYRMWTYNADLQVVASRTDAVRADISVVGEAHALQALREGNSQLRRRLTSFLLHMKAAEDLATTLDNRTPTATAASDIERIAATRWVSLLTSTAGQWLLLKRALADWSTKQWESQYFKDDQDAATLARIDFMSETMAELQFVDLRNRRDLAPLLDELRTLQVTLFETKLSTLLVEDVRQRATRWRGLALSFMRSTSNPMLTNCEAAAQQLAAQLESLRVADGFVPLIMQDKRKRLYAKPAGQGLIQYLITLEECQIVTSIHFDPTYSDQGEEMRFEEEATVISQRDSQVYASFSHFRFLQWKSLQTLTRDEGGEERFVSEVSGNCSVFRILMRTLGADEGSHHLAMVSERDYLKCFFPGSPPAPEEQLQFYEGLYALLQNFEGSESAMPWSAFLTSTVPVLKRLWLPADCDLPSLVPAAFESVCDYADTAEGCHYFLRHLSASSLLVWRMDVAQTQPLDVSVYLYTIAEKPGDSAKAEVAWSLAECALHAALVHYLFDELFRRPVSPSDLQQALSLCNAYEVTVSLRDVRQTLESYGDDLRGGLEAAVKRVELAWEGLWRKSFSLHEARGVFYSNHPTQLLFMVVGDGICTLQPAFGEDSLRVRFFSHSSHGFSDSTFRRSIAEVIESFTEALESLLAEFTLEMLRMIGRLDTGVVSCAVRCLSVASSMISARLQLGLISESASTHLQRELSSSSVLSLHEVGHWFVLISTAYGKKWLSREEQEAVREVANWEEVEEYSIPFWMVLEVESEHVLGVRAALPEHRQHSRLTPDILREDLANIRKTLEARVNQRILLARLRETGICSPLLYPPRSSSILSSMEVLHTLHFPVSDRLSHSEAHSSLTQGFSVPPFQISNRKDVFRLVQDEDCFLFRVGGTSRSAVILEVLGVATVNEQSASILWNTGVEQIRQVAIRKLAESVKSTLSEADIALISTNSVELQYQTPHDSVLSYVRELLATVFTELRAEDCSGLQISPESSVCFLYNFKAVPTPRFGPALALLRLYRQQYSLEPESRLYFEVKHSGKLDPTPLEEMLTFCVNAGVRDYTLATIPRDLSPWAWHRAVLAVAEAANAVVRWRHYCRLSDLAEFRSRVVRFLETSTGAACDTVSDPGGTQEDQVWFDGAWLATVSTDRSDSTLFASRPAHCCVLFTPTEIELICYNFSDTLKGTFEDCFCREIQENRLKFESVTSALMQKLGSTACFAAVSQPPPPQPSLIRTAFTPLTLTLRPTVNLGSLVDSEENPHIRWQMINERKTQRRRYCYSQTLLVFDHWKAKHRAVSLTSLRESRDTNGPFKVLKIMDRFSFISSLEKHESAFLAELSASDSDLIDFRSRLLHTIADLIRTRCPSFDPMSSAQSSIILSPVTRLRRSCTIESGMNEVGDSVVYLKKIIRDSLILVSVSGEGQRVTLEVNCLECVERLRNNRETAQVQESLKRELSKLRLDMKLAGLLLEAETQLLSQALLGSLKTPSVNLFNVGLLLDFKCLHSDKLSAKRGRFSIDFGEVRGCSLTSIYDHIASHCSDYDMNSRSEDPPMLFHARSPDWKVLYRGISKTHRSLSLATPEPSSAVFPTEHSVV